MSKANLENGDAEPFVWVLHCDQDGRPGICDWAKSEQEAESKLAALRAEQQQNKFWATTLSQTQAAEYQQYGLLPEQL